MGKLRSAFDNLVSKHEEYTNLLDDDEEFEKEKLWIESCQSSFMKLDIDAKNYIESRDIPIESKSKSAAKLKDTSGESSSSGMIGMQIAKGAELTDDLSQEKLSGATNNSVNQEEVIVNTQSDCQGGGDTTQDKTNGIKKNGTGTVYNVKLCGLQMEKPKLPKFSGDVREYAIFRADFKHAIETRYTKRDSITLLRTCLREKPLELIKGIGSDYDAAWEYLDSIYGDARFVSDMITQDIVKFKALQQEEDARFCDLVHLFKRCDNTLKEVGIPNDMDNSHMLSIIEQKMCTDDRKVWSRDLEREGKPATLHGLMNWMTVELKSRMRATAPVRSGTTS